MNLLVDPTADNDNTASIQTLCPARYNYPLVTVEIAADAIPTISGTLVTAIPTISHYKHNA